MKVRLVVAQGPHKGKEIPVSSSSKFVIGRSSECQLRPASQAISKKHCILQIRDGKCFVEDLNSTNGTFINEKQLTGEGELQDGDVLKIGPLDFLVKFIEKSAAAPAPTPAPVEEQAPAEEPAPAETHVEKATKQAPAPAPAAKKPVPKLAPKPAAKPASESVEEEDVAAMLLDLDEGGKPAAEEAALTEEEEVPSGSTIMDFLIPQKESGPAPAPYRPHGANKQDAQANTSNAAKEILEKYRRRPRT
jgi:predicted component of type VI protein secretion system